MDSVRLVQALPIDVYISVDHLKMVSRKTDDSFHEMLVVGIRVLENNNVAALQLTIGQNFFVPSPRSAENELIHEQVVADQQSAFHGSRGNLESLDDKASTK